MKFSKNLCLYIVTQDKLYGQSLKNFLETKLDSKLMIQLFASVKSCINEIGSWEIKPDVVILDYSLIVPSKTSTNGLHTVDHIKFLSRDTTVIVLSNEREIDAAIKNSHVGICNYVLKNQFVFS